jgi:hypothetical protein
VYKARIGTIEIVYVSVKSRGGSRYFSQGKFMKLSFAFKGGGRSTFGFQTGGVPILVFKGGIHFQNPPGIYKIR